MSDMRPASRIEDKITHSGAILGQFVGAAVGALIGCGITAATSGAGATTIIPLAVGGASLGKYLGEKLLPAIETGEIDMGAATVFYGPERRNAARVSDTVKCKGAVAAVAEKVDPVSALLGVKTPAEIIDAHTGEFVAEGAKTVLVELLEAARIADRTSMGGSISTGIQSILIGGPTFALVPRSEQSQDNAIVDWGLWGLDWASTLLGTGKGARELVSLALKFAGDVSSATLGKKSGVTIALKIASRAVKLDASSTIKAVGSANRILTSGKDLAEQHEKLNDGGLDLIEDPTQNDLPMSNEDLVRRNRLRRQMNVEGPGTFSNRTTRHVH